MCCQIEIKYYLPKIMKTTMTNCKVSDPERNAVPSHLNRGIHRETAQKRVTNKSVDRRGIFIFVPIL